MKWLGMLSAVLTLAAVILNTMWFSRFGGIATGDFLRMSIPTVLFLLLFLSAVFVFGGLSARLMAKIDKRPLPQQGESGQEEEGNGDEH